VRGDPLDLKGTSDPTVGFGLRADARRRGGTTPLPDGPLISRPVGIVSCSRLVLPLPLLDSFPQACRAGKPSLHPLCPSSPFGQSRSRSGLVPCVRCAECHPKQAHGGAGMGPKDHVIPRGSAGWCPCHMIGREGRIALPPCPSPRLQGYAAKRAGKNRVESSTMIYKSASPFTQGWDSRLSHPLTVRGGGPTNPLRVSPAAANHLSYRGQLGPFERGMR